LRIVESAVGRKVTASSPRKEANGIYLSNGRIKCETKGCKCGNIEHSCSDFVFQCADNWLKRQFESIYVEVPGVDKPVVLKALFLQELDDANKKAPNPFQDGDAKRVRTLRYLDKNSGEWRQGHLVKEVGRTMQVMRMYHGERATAPALETVELANVPAFVSTTVVACTPIGSGLDVFEEMQENFYDEIQAKALTKGNKLMAADANGQWASASVDSHTDEAVKVKWIQWPKHPAASIPYSEAENRLSKCKTPEQAYETAQKMDLVPAYCYESVGKKTEYRHQLMLVRSCRIIDLKHDPIPFESAFEYMSKKANLRSALVEAIAAYALDNELSNTMKEVLDEKPDYTQLKAAYKKGEATNRPAGCTVKSPDKAVSVGPNLATSAARNVKPASKPVSKTTTMEAATKKPATKQEKRALERQQLAQKQSTKMTEPLVTERGANARPVKPPSKLKDEIVQSNGKPVGAKAKSAKRQIATKVTKLPAGPIPDRVYREPVVNDMIHVWFQEEGQKAGSWYEGKVTSVTGHGKRKRGEAGKKEVVQYKIHVQYEDGFDEDVVYPDLEEGHVQLDFGIGTHSSLRQMHSKITLPDIKQTLSGDLLGRRVLGKFPVAKGSGAGWFPGTVLHASKISKPDESIKFELQVYFDDGDIQKRFYPSGTVNVTERVVVGSHDLDEQFVEDEDLVENMPLSPNPKASSRQATSRKAAAPPTDKAVAAPQPLGRNAARVAALKEARATKLSTNPKKRSAGDTTSIKVSPATGMPYAAKQRKTEEPPKDRQVSWEQYEKMTSSFAKPTLADWKEYNASMRGKKSKDESVRIITAAESTTSKKQHGSVLTVASPKRAKVVIEKPTKTPASSALVGELQQVSPSSPQPMLDALVGALTEAGAQNEAKSFEDELEFEVTESTTSIPAPPGAEPTSILDSVEPLEDDPLDDHPGIVPLGEDEGGSSLLLPMPEEVPEGGGSLLLPGPEPMSD